MLRYSYIKLIQEYVSNDSLLSVDLSLSLSRPFSPHVTYALSCGSGS